MDLKYKYFRLSKSIRDPLELRQFFECITSLGIACCVAKGVNGWALWREGIEALDSTNTNTVPNNVKVSKTECMLYDPADVFGLRKDKT